MPARSLYGRRVPRRILQTRCLDEWNRAFEIHQHNATTRLQFSERLRIHFKVGFRTSVRLARLRPRARAPLTLMQDWSKHGSASSTPTCPSSSSPWSRTHGLSASR